MIEHEMRSLKGDHCTVHGYHWPKPLRTVAHHIHPLGDGGEDVAANRVWTCDTGHYNIHAVYDLLKRNGGQLNDITGGTRRERELAQQGYASFTRKETAP